MQRFLQACQYIDWQHPEVLAQASALAADNDDPLLTAKNCFEFVRDEISHSVDAQHSQVTCKASEVLQHKTGYCYAKSHLLAALLRANNIPAGLCYQRLRASDEQNDFCLHGLNAVYLPVYGWYRIDARGNKPGVYSGFYPPVEQLAYPTAAAGEKNYPEIWAEPLEEVTTVLTRNLTCEAVAADLPDLELATV